MKAAENILEVEVVARLWAFSTESAKVDSRKNAKNVKKPNLCCYHKHRPLTHWFTISTLGILPLPRRLAPPPLQSPTDITLAKGRV